jgi:hypothetical protein
MPTDPRTTMPDSEDAPDTCEWRDCEKPPTMWVRYVHPKEYLCFCRDHAKESQQRSDKSTRSSLIS